MPERKKIRLRLRSRKIMKIDHTGKRFNDYGSEPSHREIAKKMLSTLDLLLEFNEKTNKKSREILSRAYNIANKADYQQSQDLSY